MTRVFIPEEKTFVESAAITFMFYDVKLRNAVWHVNEFNASSVEQVVIFERIV